MDRIRSTQQVYACFYDDNNLTFAFEDVTETSTDALWYFIPSNHRRRTIQQQSQPTRHDTTTQVKMLDAEKKNAKNNTARIKNHEKKITEGQERGEVVQGLINDFYET